MLETICQWLTQAEIEENYAAGARREELHSFIEHAVRVLDLLGQSELVKDTSGFSDSIKTEFEALKKRAARLGLVQGS
jgi:hypothetical protein